MSEVTDALGQCKLSTVESLKDYFSQEHGPAGECRPCRLAPLASLYVEVLEKAGEVPSATELSKVYETGDILTIAEAMDNIKSGAKEELRKDLEALDCFAQAYEDQDGEAES